MTLIKSTLHNIILDEVKEVPEEQLPNLLKIINAFKESVLLDKSMDFDIKRELECWEFFSHDALLKHEGTTH